MPGLLATPQRGAKVPQSFCQIFPRKKRKVNFSGLFSPKKPKVSQCFDDMENTFACNNNQQGDSQAYEWVCNSVYQL